MTRDEERKRRIDSARELRGVLQDIGRMKNEDSRTGIIHDKMMAAMDDVCERHQNGGFSAEQIALLKELMFQSAFIIDPRHKPRSRLRRDLSEMSWPRRITWAIGIISAVGGFVIWALHSFAVTWPAFISRTEAPSSQESAKQAPAQPQTAPPATPAPPLQRPPPPARQ